MGHPVDLGSLSSTVLCNLLLHGDSRFLCLDTNRFIIQSTLSFVKSTSRFKQIQTNQIVLTSKDSVFLFSVFLFTVQCFPFLFLFTVYFLSLDYALM